MCAGDVRRGCTVELAGLAVRLVASDDERAEAVASFLRHAPRTAAAPVASLAFVEEAPPVPSAAPTITTEGVDLWHAAPGALRLRAGAVTARADAQEIVVGGDAPRPIPTFRFVGFVVLTHWLAQHGWHLLHAGAVVHGDGVTLVVGGTGAGKSTFVWSAVRHGRRVLGDDLVAVHRGDAVIEARGIARPVCVPADALDDGDEDLRPVVDDGRGRVELPGDVLDHGVHRVRDLVVVARGADDHTTTEPIGGQLALRALLESSTSLLDPEVFPDLFRTAAGIARLPAWTVRHGRDPRRRVAGAALALDSIA